MLCLVRLLGNVSTSSDGYPYVPDTVGTQKGKLYVTDAEYIDSYAAILKGPKKITTSILRSYLVILN